MKSENVFRGLLMALLVAILVLAGSQPASAQATAPISLTGWFSIIWGDDSAGSSAGATTYVLTDEDGRSTSLLLDEALIQSLGGLLQFNRKYVSLQGDWLTLPGTEGKLNVQSILPDPTSKADVSPAVTGSKPWISIMCMFSDKPAQPNNLAYFQGMYSSTRPGLDHYWREQSYNTANVAGSNASGWFTLPHTEAYYNPTDTEQGSDLDKLATDCTTAANASVNFALYKDGGINMMFNTDFDNGWAWGGSKYMTLDGISQVWSVTWEPPWSYADISVIEHEMGHGFGLPHSSGSYGKTYDNAWDVMSQDRYNCAAATDPTYGCMAQHTISYHKDLLGWIPANQKYTHAGSILTITLERLAVPTTTNYKMAKIPIGGSATHFYTVEARRLIGYDSKLAGAAVIIHEVDTTRGIPAHVVDIDGNGNTADAGAIFMVGETFDDAANGISVEVLSVTPTGFKVRISSSVPRPVAPSGTISDTTPTFKWMKVANATQYSFQVYRGATLLYTETVTSGACSTIYCTSTPTTVLNYAAHKWHVRAYVGGAWKTYSAYKNFTVAPAPSGFNSTFNGSTAGWSAVHGFWSIYNSVYYRTLGVANYWSSAKHTGIYGNFTYEAKMKRGGSDVHHSNTLIIRGKPTTLNSIKAWKSSYIFNYTNGGNFSVWRENADGTETALKPWTYSATVVENGWNTLKVVANGSSLKFYINGSLVWSGTSAIFLTGQVGLAMFRDTGSMGEYFYVDWAKLTVITPDEVFLEDPFEVVAPGIEVPGGDSTHSQ